MVNSDNSGNKALLIIDMINDFNYPDGRQLFEKTLSIASNIFLLKKAAKEKNIPVIYVNDNFGQWKSDFKVLINHCIQDNTLGKEIALILKPDEDDYFVLKPKHSAFYFSTLEHLLKYLNINSLIITGIRIDSCILATTLDAYMRDYQVIIPEDCITGTGAHTEMILETLKENFKVQIRDSKELEIF